MENKYSSLESWQQMPTFLSRMTDIVHNHYRQKTDVQTVYRHLFVQILDNKYLLERGMIVITEHTRVLASIKPSSTALMTSRQNSSNQKKMRIGWMQKSGTRSISDSDAGLVIDTNHLSRYYGKGRATSISCRHILQVCTTSHIRKCAKSLPVWRGGTMVLAEQPHWPQPFLWPPVISSDQCSVQTMRHTIVHI